MGHLPHSILISPLVACRVAWISYDIVPLLPQLTELLGAQISFKKKHFCRQVGGALSEWFTVAAAAGGVCSGGSSSSTRRESILITQQPEGVEGEERKRIEIVGDGRECWQTLCLVCFFFF